MGCASSGEDKEAKKVSRSIEVEILKERKVQDELLKLLLLGTGESGKSTFFKQMKILSSNQKFTQEQLKEYVPSIHSNILNQMRVLITAAGWLNHPLEPNNKEKAQRVMTNTAWSPELADDIGFLWADQGIQLTYNCRNKFQLNDSAKYFFDNIKRYYGEDFLPSIDDVLRVRIRTTGIQEAEFEFIDLRFRLIDVGGQRSERRKWIHCFDSVTAIIYFVSLSEYDQTLREEETQNRMVESLTLFTAISNIDYFKEIPFILFLNKLDIFEEKIKVSDPKSCFPEYTGGLNRDKALEFINSKFISAREDGKKSIYSHNTIAIDTKNVEFVFNSVRNSLLNKTIDNILPT